MINLGLLAYEAYKDSTKGKTFDGRDMPEWADLGNKIQKAWEDAARAVQKYVKHSKSDPVRHMGGYPSSERRVTELPKVPGGPAQGARSTD